MTLKLDVSCCPGQWEVTVRRNAGPRCPSTSPPGPWRLIGQWEKRGAPMAPPVLLDVWHPPWCSYGCRGRCYGCRGPRELNKWAVGQVAGKRSTVRCRPPHLRHHPCPPPHLAPRRGASAQGKAGDSSTGCCQRRVLSTDVLSTQSSERGSSRDFLPDTRFTGEWGLRVCVWMSSQLCLRLSAHSLKYCLPTFLAYDLQCSLLIYGCTSKTWVDEQKAYSNRKAKDLSSRRHLVLSLQWVSPTTRSKTHHPVFFFFFFLLCFATSSKT